MDVASLVLGIDVDLEYRFELGIESFVDLRVIIVAVIFLKADVGHRTLHVITSCRPGVLRRKRVRPITHFVTTLTSSMQGVKGKREAPPRAVHTVGPLLLGDRLRASDLSAKPQIDPVNSSRAPRFFESCPPRSDQSIGEVPLRT